MSSAKYQSLEAKITEYENKHNDELDELCHQVDYDFINCLHKSIVYQTIEKKDINILRSMLESLELLYEKFTRQLECLHHDMEEIKAEMESQRKLTILEKIAVPFTLGMIIPLVKQDMKITHKINKNNLKSMTIEAEYLQSFALPTLMDSINRTHYLIQNFGKTETGVQTSVQSPMSVDTPIYASTGHVSLI